MNSRTLLKTITAGLAAAVAVAVTASPAQAVEGGVDEVPETTPTSSETVTKYGISNDNDADRQSAVTSHFKTSPVSSFSYSVGGVTVKVPTGCFLSANAKYNEATSYVRSVAVGVDCIGLAAIPKNWCNTQMYVNVYDLDDKQYYHYLSPVDTNCHTGNGIPLLVATGIPYKYKRYGKITYGILVTGTARKRGAISLHS